MLRGERGYEGKFSAKRLYGIHSLSEAVLKRTVLVQLFNNASSSLLSYLLLHNRVDHYACGVPLIVLNLRLTLFES